MNDLNNKMSHVVKFLVALFAINLFVERVLQLQNASTAGQFGLVDSVSMSFHLPGFWTGLLVPICYLMAVWAAANCLKCLEQHAELGEALWQALASTGSNLVYGATAAIVLVPTLDAWINLGARSFHFQWKIESVAIGVIGVVLRMLSRRAQQL